MLFYCLNYLSKFFSVHMFHPSVYYRIYLLLVYVFLLVLFFVFISLFLLLFFFRVC